MLCGSSARRHLKGRQHTSIPQAGTINCFDTSSVRARIPVTHAKEALTVPVHVAVNCRDAPITYWPIIGAKQSADYRLIQKVPETGQKPAVHTV